MHGKTAAEDLKKLITYKAQVLINLKVVQVEVHPRDHDDHCIALPFTNSLTWRCLSTAAAAAVTTLGGKKTQSAATIDYDNPPPPRSL